MKLLFLPDDAGEDPILIATNRSKKVFSTFSVPL
jgi:hypothetical protein